MSIADLSFSVIAGNNQFVVGTLALKHQLRTQAKAYPSLQAKTRKLSS